MTIPSIDKIKLNTLYTINGTDVWRLEWFCAMPTAGLKNVVTGEEIEGAIGSPILNQFERLETKDKTA
ncbi:MAG: hypothetical protein PHN44_09355 [Candidatus Marinimicrobia bacterium]|jgi:hypothetical protein|nr:hypothetical protein [Candidatus Neomarinimicrobiota bacterium]